MAGTLHRTNMRHKRIADDATLIHRIGRSAVTQVTLATTYGRRQ
ncbi:MAG TPA: hypothetical protein VKW08_23480 [Xanthobacteraceae bacterium]|nr:hypothetical protein [Xanthobacteraceae bacterium]